MEKEEKIIKLKLKKEKDSFAQYFEFETKIEIDKKSVTQKFIIKNAGKSQYPKGWENYQIFYKVNQGQWGRISKSFFDGQEYQFEIELKEKENQISLAWYQPYTFEKHLSFISKNQLINQTEHDLNFLNFKTKKDREREIVVILARQHPGEVMSSFFLEGFIEEFKDRKISQEIIIFPFVNLKGVLNKNHRFYNGIDFNRSWDTNEVKIIKDIKNFLQNKKISLVIDIHGDEVSKINFARKSKNKKQNNFLKKMKILSSFIVLDYVPLWKRIAKKVLGKSPAKISGMTAEEYFENQNIPAITLELSAKFDPSFHKENGKKIADLFKEK